MDQDYSQAGSEPTTMLANEEIETASESDDTPMIERFRNRIVGSGVKPASWFLANEDNWREHPIGQARALKGALSELGFIARVIVNKRTSELWPDDKRFVETLLDGHERIEISLAEGEDTAVPYDYVDLAPDEERYALLTLDPIGAMATMNKEKASELLAQVRTKSPGIEAMLNDLRSQAGEALEALARNKPAADPNITQQWLVIVSCTSESEQVELFNQLQEEGLDVRCVVS